MMTSRCSALVAVALVGLLPCAASAGFGSPEALEYGARLPEARQNPATVLAHFNENPAGDQERLILFMLLMTLGEEKLIAPDDFRLTVERGITDVADNIRAHAVYHLHVKYDGEALEAVYRRCTLDRSLGVRYNAVERLVDFPSASSLRYLDALLGDESIEVRGLAAGTLCTWHRHGKLAGVQDLFTKAADSTDIRRAGCAAKVLVTCFDRPPRVSLLNDYLAAELQKPRPFFAAGSVNSIIKTLARVRDSSSRPVLEAAARHANQSVAEEAKQALAIIQSLRND